RVVARGAEFFDGEDDRLEADRRDAHAAEHRADGHAVLLVVAGARDVPQRGDTMVAAAVVDEDAGEAQVAHGGTQLAGGEQRDERVPTPVERILEQLALN